MKLPSGDSEQARGKTFFTQCLLDLWRFLPQVAMVDPGVDGFTKRLGSFMEERSVS